MTQKLPLTVTKGSMRFYSSIGMFFGASRAPSKGHESSINLYNLTLSERCSILIDHIHALHANAALQAETVQNSSQLKKFLNKPHVTTYIWDQYVYTTDIDTIGRVNQLLPLQNGEISESHSRLMSFMLGGEMKLRNLFVVATWSKFETKQQDYPKIRMTAEKNLYGQLKNKTPGPLSEMTSITSKDIDNFLFTFPLYGRAVAFHPLSKREEMKEIYEKQILFLTEFILKYHQNLGLTVSNVKEQLSGILTEEQLAQLNYEETSQTENNGGQRSKPSSKRKTSKPVLDTSSFTWEDLLKVTGDGTLIDNPFENSVNLPAEYLNQPSEPTGRKRSTRDSQPSSQSTESGERKIPFIAPKAYRYSVEEWHYWADLFVKIRKKFFTPTEKKPRFHFTYRELSVNTDDPFYLFHIVAGNLAARIFETQREQLWYQYWNVKPNKNEDNLPSAKEESIMGEKPEQKPEPLCYYIPEGWHKDILEFTEVMGAYPEFAEVGSGHY